MSDKDLYYLLVRVTLFVSSVRRTRVLSVHHKCSDKDLWIRLVSAVLCHVPQCSASANCVCLHVYISGLSAPVSSSNPSPFICILPLGFLENCLCAVPHIASEPIRHAFSYTLKTTYRLITRTFSTLVFLYIM